MTFYRQVVQVEILSTEPWREEQLDDLAVINEAITDGESSGDVTITTHNQEVSRERMAELLIMQGTEPSFLLGDDNADDEDDEL